MVQDSEWTCYSVKFVHYYSTLENLQQVGDFNVTP